MRWTTWSSSLCLAQVAQDRKVYGVACGHPHRQELPCQESVRIWSQEHNLLNERLSPCQYGILTKRVTKERPYEERKVYRLLALFGISPKSARTLVRLHRPVEALTDTRLGEYL